MKNKILLEIAIVCVLIIGVVIFIKKPFNFKEENNLDIQTSDKNQNNSSNEEKISDEIIGKWITVSAVNSEDGTKTENLKDVFGSSYSQYGSYLELTEDGSFIDAIQPITDGSKSNTGTYIIKRDYYKPGDCYVILSYLDGKEEKLQRVFIDDSNTPYLVLNSFINGYQLTLRK